MLTLNLIVDPYFKWVTFSIPFMGIFPKLVVNLQHRLAHSGGGDGLSSCYYPRGCAVVISFLFF